MYALNVSINLENSGFKLYRPHGKEKCVNLIKTKSSNINPDFYIEDAEKNIAFYKDHTAPEIIRYKNKTTIPGDLQEFTTRELMQNKGCYDILILNIIN
jgi:hypothetical protein